jgi:hypothetical protein
MHVTGIGSSAPGRFRKGDAIFVARCCLARKQVSLHLSRLFWLLRDTLDKRNLEATSVFVLFQTRMVAGWTSWPS